MSLSCSPDVAAHRRTATGSASLRWVRNYPTLLTIIWALCLGGCGERFSQPNPTGKFDQPEGAIELPEVDPGQTDNWFTEAMASSLLIGPLGSLESNLLGRTSGAEDCFINGDVSLKFRGMRRIREPGVDLLIERSDGTSLVQPPLTAAAAHEQLARRWFLGAGLERQLKFKVTAIEVHEDCIATRLRVEAGSTSEFRCLEVHELADVSWSPGNPGETPKIVGIEVLESERIYRDDQARLFADCTVQSLRGNSWFAQQFLQGQTDWHQRLPVHNAIDMWGVMGMALGDVDGNGLEDLFVCEGKGVPNRLLFQKSDGSLSDGAAAWGVDWVEGCHSALLVDLDNDGRQDLVATVMGSVIVARNENSRFEIRAALPMTQQTTHLAVADYDRDGLLDIYACAYHKDKPLYEDQVTLGGASLDNDSGAPNVLFRNRIDDGIWEFVNVTQSVGLDDNNSKLSFAASWDDLDNDGDLDLYVANDFGRNNLYRNDSEIDGSVLFSDIAGAAGSEDNAFGMSISWGDYNRDGFMDAYVANMWSAAGKRIVNQEQFRPGISGADRAYYLRLAKGNTLLRNAGGSGRFEDVSETAGVEMGRWAWSSPYVDLNNDGWEDLVVANGYVTGLDETDL